MTRSIESIHRAVLVACVVAIATAVPVWAEDPEPSKDHRTRMLEKFDTDGDGEISDSERKAAAEKRRSEHKAKVLEKFDADGDGELSTEERKAFNESDYGKQRAAAMKILDTNGDGVFSQEERQAARAKGKGNRGAQGKKPPESAGPPDAGKPSPR
jgi:hypothetical protein